MTLKKLNFLISFFLLVILTQGCNENANSLETGLVKMDPKTIMFEKDKYIMLSNGCLGNYKIKYATFSYYFENPPSEMFFRIKEQGTDNLIVCDDADFLPSLHSKLLLNDISKIAFVLTPEGLNNWPEVRKKDIVIVLGVVDQEAEVMEKVKK